MWVPHLLSTERKMLALVAVVAGPFVALTAVAGSVWIIVLAIGEREQDWVMEPFAVWVLAVVASAVVVSVAGVRLLASGRRAIRTAAPVMGPLWATWGLYVLWSCAATLYLTVFVIYFSAFLFAGLLALIALVRVGTVLIHSAG